MESDLEALLRLDVRLPRSPFTSSTLYFSACDYEDVRSGDFGDVLASLCSSYGDESVTVLAVQPDPVRYFRRHFGYYPCFRLSVDEVPSGYWEGMDRAPGAAVGGSIFWNAEVIAAVGSRGQWAVWAERDWELGILACPHRNGPWEEAGTRFMAVDQALDRLDEEFCNPPLSDVERRALLATFGRE